MEEEENRDVAVAETDVVVVGAGAAGLQCANLLLHRSPSPKATSSLSVLVLEAKDRIGGRINSMTEKISEDDGSYFVWDEGAAWIHGLGYAWPLGSTPTVDENETNTKRPNPMVDLLTQRYGGVDEMLSHIDPVFLRGNPWMRPKHVLHSTRNLAMFADGVALSEESTLAGLELHFSRLSQAYKSKENGGHDSLQRALDNLERGEGLASRLADFYVHLMELWYGAPATCIPLCEPVEEPSGSWSDETYTNEGDFEGPHCKVRDGMHAVLQPLLSGVIDCIRLQEAVISIREKSASRIRVETDTGLAVDCRACVVTVPLGVLRACMDDLFDPPLSLTTQSMIRSLRMGSYKKILLEFSMSHSPPWPTDCKLIGVLVGQRTTLPTSCLQVMNVNSTSTGTYFLEVILVNAVAEWASYKPEKEIQDAVLEFLQLGMGVDPWLSPSIAMGRRRIYPRSLFPLAG